jgi:hypothetical protein
MCINPCLMGILLKYHLYIIFSSLTEEITFLLGLIAENASSKQIKPVKNFIIPSSNANVANPKVNAKPINKNVRLLLNSCSSINSFSFFTRFLEDAIYFNLRRYYLLR